MSVCPTCGHRWDAPSHGYGCTSSTGDIRMEPDWLGEEFRRAAEVFAQLPVWAHPVVTRDIAEIS